MIDFISKYMIRTAKPNAKSYNQIYFPNKTKFNLE